MDNSMIDDMPTKEEYSELDDILSEILETVEDYDQNQWPILLRHQLVRYLKHLQKNVKRTFLHKVDSKIEILKSDLTKCVKLQEQIRNSELRKSAFGIIKSGHIHLDEIVRNREDIKKVADVTHERIEKRITALYEKFPDPKKEEQEEQKSDS